MFSLTVDFVLAIIVLLAYTLSVTRIPVHAVLVLVLLFVSGAWLLFLSDSIFLALVFCLVYIGAVAVSSSFCVILLVPSTESIAVERKKRLNIFSLFFLSTAINISNVLKFSTEIQISVENFKTFEENFLITNAITFKDIGYLLYTHLNLVFILISFSLLIAMFGSIFITIFHTNDLKKQEIFLQIKRENSLFPFSFRN